MEVSSTPTAAPIFSLDQIVQAASNATKARAALVGNFKQLFVEQEIQPTEVFDMNALLAAVKDLCSKKGSMAVKYYMLTGDEHWTGCGNVKKAFKEAHAFDAANPDLVPKRMDQYLIPDDQANEIALKIQKDVRTISNKVIKYADLMDQQAKQAA